MLCLSGFELYSRWVPLAFDHKPYGKNINHMEKTVKTVPTGSNGFNIFCF